MKRCVSVLLGLAVVLCAMGTAQAGNDPPLAYWDMDENGGSTITSVQPAWGLTVVGNLVDNTRWTGGAVSGPSALYFDGVNDYVSVMEHCMGGPDPTACGWRPFIRPYNYESVTWEFWIKPHATSRTWGDVMVGHGNKWKFYLLQFRIH